MTTDNKNTKTLQHIPLKSGENEAKILKKKVKKIKRKQNGQNVTYEEISNERGVVLLTRIPKYFAEPQMFKYFSQFGEVTRIKLLRSRKTNNPRGTAFIEFEFKEIAKIVAQTMNNYLMFNKILKCQYLDVDKIKPNTFNGWNKTKKFVPPRVAHIREFNKKTTDPDLIKFKKSQLQKRRDKQQEKLLALGIDYDISQMKVNKDFEAPEIQRVEKYNPDQDDSKQLNTTDDALAVVDLSDDEVTFKVQENIKRKSIGGEKIKKETKNDKKLKEKKDKRENKDSGMVINNKEKKMPENIEKGNVKPKSTPKRKNSAKISKGAQNEEEVSLKSEAEFQKSSKKSKSVIKPKTDSKRKSLKRGDLSQMLSDDSDTEIKPQTSKKRKSMGKSNLNKSMSAVGKPKAKKLTKKRKYDANKTL